jgi:predicted outer membrane lipoprotein
VSLGGRVLLASLLLLGSWGCSRAAPDATADGVLHAWLEHMEDSQEDPKEAREAYRLLGPAARANLAERAARASQTEGRRTEPYELLAAGFFGLKFRPQSMKVTVVGDKATVEVSGERGAERASVVCVKEGASWRVEPELPPLAPLPMRGAGGL